MLLLMCRAWVSNRSKRFSILASICPSCRTLSDMSLMLESTLFCIWRVPTEHDSRCFWSMAISLFLLSTSLARSFVICEK